MVLVSVYFLLDDGGKKTPLRKLHGPLGIVWTKEESNGERERERDTVYTVWMDASYGRDTVASRLASI